MTEKQKKYRIPGTSNNSEMKVQIKDLPKDPKSDVPGTSNHDAKKKQKQK